VATYDNDGLRILRVVEGSLEPAGSSASPAEPYSGALAVNDALVAVVRTTAEGRELVDVYDITPDGLGPPVSIDTGYVHIHLALRSNTVAISGVTSRTEPGHLQLVERRNDQWELDTEVRHRGGGAVVATEVGFLVQTNTFFAQPLGSWTVIEDGATTVELPAWATSAARVSTADAGAAYVLGNSRRHLVMTFQRDESVGFSPFRLTSVRTGTPDDRLGAAVVGLAGGRLLAARPGASVGDVAGRGVVDVLDLVDGPIGCTIIGTDGDDELVGTEGPDVICGLAGDDNIRGASGDDVLLGGDGDDRLFGGPGQDRLVGDGDNDLLDGGPGADVIEGGPGRDDARGGAGDDVLDGGDENDVLRGDAGDDLIVGGPGFDREIGGSGSDRCERACDD
jgi:Ca2+-binding RTX toxin-like protein